MSEEYLIGLLLFGEEWKTPVECIKVIFTNDYCTRRANGSVKAKSSDFPAFVLSTLLGKWNHHVLNVSAIKNTGWERA